MDNCVLDLVLLDLEYDKISKMEKFWKMKQI